MANKTNKTPQNRNNTAGQAPTLKEKKNKSFSFEGMSAFVNNPYFPGLLLLCIFTVIALFTYGDYGIAWDEPFQRGPGLLSFNYMFHGNQELFLRPTDNHGAGYEILLVIIEKLFNLTDSRDIYMMRHLVTHLLFLGGAFSLYILTWRLFKNKLLASLAFLMLVCAPRLYAHSFFNSKDIPFLSMVIICFTVCNVAFEKNKAIPFLMLGLLCGYATSIRIMGVMLAAIIIGFLILYALMQLFRKEKPVKPLVNMLAFSLGFCLLLYSAWPYLWKNPIHNFVESFNKLSRFDFWTGDVLIAGKFIKSTNLPWTYFPTWFFITLPEIWLLTGLAGIVWVVIDFFKKPLIFLGNNRERNFLLYIVCFFTPILAVIVLHSIIYDDWRHLYFVYPSFILLSIYFINKLLQTRYKKIVGWVCVAQVAFVAIFMVWNHPFNQVYFNNLVSHSSEFLRKNYEMDYWGCSFKQGLENLVANDPSPKINVNCDYRELLDNNVLILPEDQRTRIQFTDIGNANYYITNFRGHTIEYPENDIVYAAKVLNSKILCVYKAEKDPAVRKKIWEAEISYLTKSLATNPNDLDAQARIANAFLRNAQYDSSEAHYRKALEISPNSPEIFMSMAGAYFTDKKYDIAIEWFKKMIALNRNNANPYSFVGVCYFYLKQPDSTIYYLKQAVSVDPNNPGFYSSLSNTYRSMNLPDSARKYDSLAHNIQKK